MARFTFKCNDCGELTIHNVPIEERDSRTDLECEVCRGVNLKRILDVPNKTVRGTKKGDFNSKADGLVWNGKSNDK